MLDNLERHILKSAESAAVAAAEFIGTGDAHAADDAATQAMRAHLGAIEGCKGKVKIGEGERDEAPMLYIGETLGTGPFKYDIALDPLEGTNLCIRNEPGAITAIAIGEENTIMHAPDCYMLKLATAPDINPTIVDIKESCLTNVKNIALYRGCDISEVNVVMLDRERHTKIINEVRAAGARVSLIRDGDISAVIKVVSGYADMYYGIGGAPEGVLAAAAVRGLGGKLQGKLILDTNDLLKRASAMGIIDPEATFSAEEMVGNHSIFIATAVTDTHGMSGIKFRDNEISVDSLIIKNRDGKKCISHINNVYCL